MGPAARATALLTFMAVLSAAPLPAQDYEARYGKAVDVSLSDIVLNPESYRDRAVRTRGRLDISNNRSGTGYILRAGVGASVLIVPVSMAAGAWEKSARRWLGHDVDITGVVTGQSLRGSDVSQEATIAIQFWSFIGPREKVTKDMAERAQIVTLESLVSRVGQRDGQLVRVVGRFRGRNLFGDLPAKSQQSGGDWVIKQDEYAAWVTDVKPKGDGFELDIDMKKDTGRWLEVIGQVTSRNGLVYLRAAEVRLTSPPSEAAVVAPAPPPPPKPPVPPVVVFALPLDGETGVSPTGHFVVQFSKDMDVESFRGRVHLSYAPLLPGDRVFDGMSISYDEGLRALTVVPGDVMRVGRRLELRLLPGIMDTEGLPLTGREGIQAPAGAVEVLRYLVGG
jgi:hypothetical protein